MKSTSFGKQNKPDFRKQYGFDFVIQFNFMA